jgi:hypothetical protein
MGKDINRIRRELKETELEEKTIRIITDALEDVKQNTQSYIQDLSLNQFFLLMFILPMIGMFGAAVSNRRESQRKTIT